MEALGFGFTWFRFTVAQQTLLFLSLSGLNHLFSFDENSIALEIKAPSFRRRRAVGGEDYHENVNYANEFVSVIKMVMKLPASRGSGDDRLLTSLSRSRSSLACNEAL